MIVSQDGDARMVEVAHEALLRKWPRLRSWLDDAREFLAGKQQLERDLRDWERVTEADKTGALLTGLKLNRARGWMLERPHQLTAEERALVQASIDHAEAEEKRKARSSRNIMRASIAAALVLAVTAAVSVFSWNKASIAESEAVEQKKEAVAARDDTEAAKKQVEEQLARSEQLIYVNRIQSAQREWVADKAEWAARYLEATPESFRNWEYDYLKTLFNGNREPLDGSRMLGADGLNTFNGATAAAFSPDGESIARVGWDNKVTLWDANQGTLKDTLKWEIDLHGKGDLILDIAFSPDGLQIVTGSRDYETRKRTVMVWDVSTGVEALTLQSPPPNFCGSVAFSPDGKWIAAGCWDTRDAVATFRLWDARTGAVELTKEGFSGPVVFSPDSTQYTAVDRREMLWLFDIRGGEPVSIRGSNFKGFKSVVFSIDGERIVSGNEDGTLKLWDARTGADLWDARTDRSLSTLFRHDKAVSAVAFSPDGKRIVSSSDNGTIKLWDARTGEALLSFAGQGNSGSGTIAFSPNGTKIVSAGSDGIKLWEAARSDAGSPN